MKKISRRSFLMAAGTAAAAAALSACGGSGSSTAASASGEASNSYTMFMRSAYVDWLKELKWYDVAEERTGIHVEYISGPEDMNDLYSEVDQRVISGDLPDAAMTRLAPRASLPTWPPTSPSTPPTCRLTWTQTPTTRTSSPTPTAPSTALSRRTPSSPT